VNVLKRLIYKEVFLAVGLVLLAFLSLFFFFDFIDELGAIGHPSPTQPELIYQVPHALLFCALLLPMHLYELLPISVLIGSVLVFARFAQSSEFTILRTSGLDPWQALRLLGRLGLVFVVLTYVTGDHIAPMAGKAAQLYKARFDGLASAGPVGAWLREKRPTSQVTVNVQSMTGNDQLQGIRVLEFDAKGMLVRRIQAAAGEINSEGLWQLADVEQMTVRNDSVLPPQMRTEHLPTLAWDTTLTAEMVSVALLKPERMSTSDLWNYVRHLDANGQSAQRYEIEFWRKVFYPLSCVVMLVLALPFAYLHFRSGSIAGYVFIGVMVGISFFLLNEVFGFLGRLHQWWPWLTAAVPSLLYTLASLTAFGWLVLRR
jgi:lipopolysaccharide export system permease protein